MILAILQARVSASRLPKKVLLPLLGKPMIFRQIERIKHSKRIDQLVVATSYHESDEQLFNICKQYGVECMRGNLNDVLDRFFEVAKLYKPDHVVRLTGDCPLIDPRLIDDVIQFHLEGNFDYTSNTLEPTFPDGLDVEIFKYSCLIDAKENAYLPSEKEHVTPFMTKNLTYNKGSYKGEHDFSNYRWTVDERLDFELVEKIYSELYTEGSLFNTKDILDYIEHNPELKNFNTLYKRNEGYIKSLEDDASTFERK